MPSKDVYRPLALPLHFLKESKKIQFDIYVRAGGKPVLYCRSDDLHIAERIARLKSKKNLQYFLILKEDYSAFIDYLGADLEKAFQNSDKPLEEQVQDIYFQTRGLLTVLSTQPESREYYNILKSTCPFFYAFFVEHGEALKHLYHCHFEDSAFDKWMDHSIRVTALSSRLIQEAGANEKGKPIFDVILGAFLHDLGHLKHEDQLEPAMKPDFVDYKAHPTHGAEMMNMEHVSPWVKSVIQKHEEHIDGSGFPARIRENDMDPALLCVAAANAFDRMHTLQEKSLEVALKDLLIEKMGALPLPLLQKLQGIIKTF